MFLAEALAEALHSNRVLVWGPPRAKPPIFAGSSWLRWVFERTAPTHASRHFSSVLPPRKTRRYFEPLSPCSWDNVTRPERIGLFAATSASRVAPSSVYRGGPGLYAPASEGFGDASTISTLDWASAIARCGLDAMRCDARTCTPPERGCDRSLPALCSYVFRPQPWLAKRIAEAWDEIDARLPKPRLGLHLRLSDNELEAKDPWNGRVYTNKPLLTAEDFRRGERAGAAPFSCTQVRPPSTRDAARNGLSLAQAAGGEEIRIRVSGDGHAPGGGGPQGAVRGAVRAPRGA